MVCLLLTLNFKGRRGGEGGFEVVSGGIWGLAYYRPCQVHEVVMSEQCITHIT